MRCIECDEEVTSPMVKVQGDFACSMTCALEYERETLESLESEEKLWEWLHQSEAPVLSQRFKFSPI